LDVDLGTTQAEGKTSDLKRFLVRGSYFNLAGNWSIQAILRRPGQYDVVQTFPVSILTDPNDTDPANPAPVTADSVANGKTLYQSNCVLCHGLSGKGDGPAGRALNPPPADLTYHTIPGVHTDGQLFYWISQGLPRTAMPRFASILTEKQRWDLVNFIRTLAQPVKK
jgi:mono/diheme cytochrome c family protein